MVAWTLTMFMSRLSIILIERIHIFATKEVLRSTLGYICNNIHFSLDYFSKIEKVPRDIQRVKSGNISTSSEKGLVSTSRTYASPKRTGPVVRRSKRSSLDDFLEYDWMQGIRSWIRCTTFELSPTLTFLPRLKGLNETFAIHLTLLTEDVCRILTPGTMPYYWGFSVACQVKQQILEF